MKLPNWFKIVWWLILVSLLSSYLAVRLATLAAGAYTLFDLSVLAIWTALAFAPLFSEFELGSLKLKTKLEEVKEHVDDRVEKLRAEIRNTIDFRTQINPQFFLPHPPPDSQLPSLEEKIRSVLSDALRDHGLRQPRTEEEVFSVDPDVSQLFAVRYRLERAVNRIASKFDLVLGRTRPAPLTRQVRFLVETDVLDHDLGAAIQEVYAICSVAVHGGEVSDAKLVFVRRVAPELLATLEAIGAMSEGRG